jgi:CheY-like chemotaxis protein
VGLPLAPAAADGTPVAATGVGPAERRAPAPGAARGRLRVLLVEDHPATRRAMAAIVRSLGHEVRDAATLAEAMALADGAAFDLVISDLALPDGSGHDLMRRLKERRRDLHGVAVSGYGMADDVRRSREAGFDEHLTKPVSREKIQEALSHVGA